MRKLIVPALFATTAMAYGGTLYKSVAPDGTVVYSDQPPQTGKLEKTFNFANLPSTPLPESVVRYRQELEKSAQNRISGNANSRDPVLFWARWCGYCKQAEAYLTEKRIGFQKRDIDTPEGMRGLAEAGGGRGVPVLLVNGRKVQGFSRAAYDALFAAAR
jgi:glutaredoxin